MADTKLSPVQPFTEGAQTVGAWLGYFGSSSAELGGAHKNWIANYFGPAMNQNPNAWIDLIGHSSVGGSDAANVAVSNKRMDSVEKFIRSVVPNIKVNLKTPKGSQEAKTFHNTDMDGYWRAVMVRWYGTTTPIQVPLYPAEVADWMKRVYKLIPTAELWRAAAERVLITAEGGLKAAVQSEAQKQAIGLVDRVFKLTTSGQSKAQSVIDVQQIKGVFDQMRPLIQAINKGDLYLHESVEAGHTNHNAYTMEGHWIYKKPSDGIWYVRANIEPATDEFIVDCTIHEFAHFCGPLSPATKIGHALIGGQPAYGNLALQLGRSDALRNASSYAWLAYLARKPAAVWLTAT
jgi:hypothetical protein